MILRGETGAGKSTFLNTVGLFRTGAVTERIAGTDDVDDVLKQISSSTEPRIIVLEGREALGEVARASLEASMHAINTFVRTDAGRYTLVVWPTNTDPLTEESRSRSIPLGGAPHRPATQTLARARLGAAPQATPVIGCL